MDELRGRLTGDPPQKTATSRGREKVEATLETWSGSVHTVLLRAGDYLVYVREKDGPQILVAKGNVNTSAVDAHTGEDW